MYSIDKQDDGSFNLTKDGAFLASFPTLEDAEKAKDIAEGKGIQTGTYVDDGQGLEYPKGTDGYHSGCETTLSFEDRFDAVLRHLADVHGIHLPCHLAPKE
jgi:hypothetical protein